jgi:indolepyruvate ferredoxin oxidoreductase
MAAHLEGKSASVLDFMGFAQKGGSVLSFVRLADVPERLNQVRIDTQQADAVLACDIVVAASPEALQTVRRGRTRLLVNTHEVPVAESIHNPDASLQVDQLLDKLEFAAGPGRLESFDAQGLAEDFLGDTIVSNILAMGYAWQRGLIPLSLAAMQRAIELNAVAVPTNLLAFSLGRLAAQRPELCQSLLETPTAAPEVQTLERLLASGKQHLTAYQNTAYAERFEALVQRVAAAERKLGLTLEEGLSQTVARSALKLMAYKDEYEVARMYSAPAFREALAQQFEGDLQLEFYMAPPLLARGRPGQPPAKMRLGGWMLPLMRVLAQGRALRGTVLDVFGHTEERRMERGLINAYEARVDELLAQLSPERVKLAQEILALPLSMRGFGHVKARQVALAQAREAELLHRFNPQRYARPAPKQPTGQFKGIAIKPAA